MSNQKTAITFLFLFISISLFSQSKKGCSLVWKDNFKGSTLDTTAWNIEVAESGMVNNELQRYTNSRNIELSKGKLLLTAKKENSEYTSARINTKGKQIFTYGIVEIKAKLPQGTGTWPALWMLGQNVDEVGWPACGELDIMEHVGKHPGFIHSTIHSSYAWYIDQVVFGKFQDGTEYTWLLSGFGFIATTLSGVFAGELIKSDLPQKKIALYLFIFGIAGILAGMFLGIWHPIIKKLWISSFVLASSGVCFLLMALFYWIIEVKGKVKWAFPLKVIGMNAIVAYVLSHVFNFYLNAEMVLYGIKQFVGEFYSLVLTIGGFGIIYLLLWYMYKNKTFIKV
jgi:hypothetical protein